MTGADVIVVGAGSAGCAVAARLSEDPSRRVVLLEAGGDGRWDPRIAVPPLFVALHRSGRDWAYRTEPEPALAGRRLHWPRGKVLGGSSATNYLVYLRGHPAVFDGWAAAGCTGWSHDDLLPVFRRLEDHPLGPSAWHGAGGPVGVGRPRLSNPLTDAFIAAGTDAGLAYSDDLEGGHPEGVGRYRLTLRDGRRESAATAYLTPAAGRDNLAVRTGVTVRRLLLSGDRVSGVEIGSGGRREQLRARAVVLCGGAVGSPALLLRSGIGPAEDLRGLGVPVVADRGQVGANLADHLLAPVVFAGPLRHTFPGLALDPTALPSYLARRRGPLTTNVAEAGAIVRSAAELEAPDVQLTFGLASILDHGRRAVRPAFSLAVVGLQPRSRGRLALRSHDPEVPPAIAPGYLTDPGDADRASLRHGIRLARRLADMPALAALRGVEREPGAAVRDDDAALDAWIARRAETCYHPVGTCRMGADPDAVVDPRLRVRGVERLWVADASIMPQIPAANTNAACLMIGERAADLLAEDL